MIDETLFSPNSWLEHPNKVIYYLRRFFISLFLLFPILFGFNSVVFFSFLFLEFYVLAIRFKVPYVFYILCIIYKHGSNELLIADKSILNLITIFFSFYYTFIFFKNRRKQIQENLSLTAFGFLWVYLVLNSIFVSNLSFLSINKSISIFTYYISLYYIVTRFGKKIIFFLVLLALGLVVTSIIIPRSITTYSELGFHKGILNQSQAYGYFMALMLPFLFYNYKLCRYKNIELIIIIFSLVFIFLTKMRSAYLTSAFSIIVISFSQADFRRWRYYILFGVFALGIYSLAFDNTFLYKVFDKRNSEIDSPISSFDEMISSRNKLANPSLDNFSKNPIFGIGLGVPSNYNDTDFDINEAWGVTYLPGTKVIISFPVEKGVVYTLILEELGLFGMFFFILFIISLLIGVNIERNVFSFITVFSVLIISTGEAGLFSPNGGGFFAILAMFFSNYFTNYSNFERNLKFTK
jgi:hypothetical protein